MHAYIRCSSYGPRTRSEEDRSDRHPPRATDRTLASPPIIMAPPPPELMEELADAEEVLLRFPPQEPALLVRAALVCKRWRRIVSGPAFRRRFRELHRAPPMLGFFCNTLEESTTSCFVPASATAFCTPDAGIQHRSVLDARHGRVLLQYLGSSGDGDALVVWDPITDEKLALPYPDLKSSAFSWTAAVTCAARVPCNHLDCNRGPFLVVFVASGSGRAFICTYSSGDGTWSDPISTEQRVDIVTFMPIVLVGNAFYFGFPMGEILLEYDLESHNMSVIGLPGSYNSWLHFVLEGGLGFAAVHESELCIWRKAGPGCSWAQHRVIDLDTLLPSPTDEVVGFVDGTSVFFLRAEHVLFMIDLKTNKVKKVWEDRSIYSVIPYMSFYTPALEPACTNEGSSMCVSVLGATCSVKGPSLGDSSA